MSALQPIMPCLHFLEHKGWQLKHPTGPVTWDGWCSICGFRLEDKDFASGVAIEGNGRRLEHVQSVKRINGETFVSNVRKIVCSDCCPAILGKSE